LRRATGVDVVNREPPSMFFANRRMFLKSLGSVLEPR
jgi:hypothetical protein